MQKIKYCDHLWKTTIVILLLSTNYGCKACSEKPLAIPPQEQKAEEDTALHGVTKAMIAEAKVYPQLASVLQDIRDGKPVDVEAFAGPTQPGSNPLLQALYLKNEKIIDLILAQEKTLPPNKQFANTLGCIADGYLGATEVGVLNRLLEEGVDLNKKGDDGKPILTLSAIFLSKPFDDGRFALFRKLFLPTPPNPPKLDINAPDKNGTLLQNVIRTNPNNTPLFSELLSVPGIDLKLKDGEPFLASLANERPDLLPFFLENDEVSKHVNLDEKGTDGRTAVHNLLIKNFYTPAFFELMDRNPDPTIQDNQGNTLLHNLFLEPSGLNNLNSKLIALKSYKHKLDFTIKNNGGKTPEDCFQEYIKNVEASAVASIRRRWDELS